MMGQQDFVLILGGSEVASATALRLFQAGIPVAVWVPEGEAYLRHNLCFGAVQFVEKRTIEGVEGTQLPEDWLDRTAGSFGEKLKENLTHLWLDKKIPVLVNIPLEYFEEWVPQAVVETRIPEQDQSGAGREPLQLPFECRTVGLVPYHLPERHVTAAVETRLNYHLGRVYFEVGEIPRAPRLDAHFFHLPFETIHTPIEGMWMALKEIGDSVAFNEPLGKVDEIEIRSAEDGQVWGIALSGRFVAAGQSIALIFKGRPNEDYQYFSFQDRAIANGVLRALERIR